MKKTLARTPKRHLSVRSFPLRVRVVGGLALVGLTAALGLTAARPAHTAAGPVTVAVGNTVQTRDADNAARQPFAARLYPDPQNTASFTVPAGKRLVIQQVSAFTGSPTAQDIELFDATSGRGAALRVPFAVRSGYRYASQSLTFYADPGSTVYIYANDSDYNDINGFDVDIVGYYVDVP